MILEKFAKVITKIEPNIPEDVMTKIHLDTEISKLEGPKMYTEKDHIEFMDLQRFNEAVLFAAEKTLIQKHYDEGLFDNYDNAKEISKCLILLVQLTKEVDLI